MLINKTLETTMMYLMLGYSNIEVFEYMYDLQWHIGFSSSVHLPIFQR